jgi:hypothetical protein
MIDLLLHPLLLLSLTISLVILTCLFPLLIPFRHYGWGLPLRLLIFLLILFFLFGFFLFLG